MAPNIDVYIIPDMKQTGKYRPEKKRRRTPGDTWKKIIRDLFMITGVMGGATLLALGFRQMEFSEANTIMIYLLAVLLSSYIANRKIYALYSSMLSVLLFNFFFTEPYYSLKAYDKGYPTTFLMLFIVGLFTGTMTRKLKQQNQESAKTAYRTEILLENSQKLRCLQIPKSSVGSGGGAGREAFESRDSHLSSQ